jgi:nitrite reductase/ring-hydroxylating ferredoxin subunit
MAQLAVLIAGLLLIAESQASDVVEADPSTAQGFLSKQQFSSKQAFDAANYNNFILPAVSNVKPEMGANSFTIIDDKPNHQPKPEINTKDDSNMHVTLSAIGVGLLALVTMLGASMRRGLQPATILAGNNMMEMRSQGPGVGWGQQSSLNSRPLTSCYATPSSGPATDEALEGTYLGTPSGPFDPLGTYESSARKAEINNGRLAMVGITSLSGRPAGRKVHSSTALGVFGKTRESQKKFVPAVSQSELSPGKAVSGICAGLDICVAVDTDGSVYALGNKSPVLGTPMAAGRVSDGLIKDPLTGTSFNVRSGAVEGPWCPNFPFSILFSVIQPTGLPVFKCKTGGGAVQVEVDVNAKTNFESGYWKGVLDAQGKTDGGYY